MLASGTVLSLHRWPVKSLGGEPVAALRIDGRGAGGDRAQALFTDFAGTRRAMTVREVPRMLGWAAAYPQAPGEALDPDAPPLPLVTGPDGRTFAWDDPALPGALSDDLGRDVELVRDLALMPDLRDSLPITVEASHAALEDEMAQPIDLRRFRTNLHVRLDADAFAEQRWKGRRVRVGEAELELLHPVRALRDPDARPGHGREVAGAPAPARARPRDALRHQRPRRPPRDGARRRPGHRRLSAGQPRGRRPATVPCGARRRRGRRAEATARPGGAGPPRRWAPASRWASRSAQMTGRRRAASAGSLAEARRRTANI